MNRDTMVEVLREVLNDSSTSFNSWSDERLLMYLSEGQDKFCEETGFFRDALTHTITLEAGTAFYAIPARVIQILDIYNGTRKLGKVLTGKTYDLESGSDFTGATSGQALQWQTDVESGLIQINPTPGADQAGTVLNLRVWRYSLEDLADDEVEVDPEIPSRFHGAPIEWAAYRALMHHDEETQDPVKAGEHLNAFTKIYVADGRRAFDRYHNVEARVSVNSAYVA